MTDIREDVIKWIDSIDWEYVEKVKRAARGWLGRNYVKFCDEKFYYNLKAVEACTNRLRELGYDMDKYDWVVKETLP